MLQRALYGGGEVAAARAALRSAGARGTTGELQREAKGGGGGAARRVGASAKQEGPGWLSTASAGGAALHTVARQSRGVGGRGKGPI